MSDLNLRVSHLGPVHPVGQLQSNDSPILLHVPPFRQGPDAQASIGAAT